MCTLLHVLQKEIHGRWAGKKKIQNCDLDEPCYYYSTENYLITRNILYQEHVLLHEFFFNTIGPIHQSILCKKWFGFIFFNLLCQVEPKCEKRRKNQHFLSLCYKICWRYVMWLFNVWVAPYWGNQNIGRKTDF